MPNQHECSITACTQTIHGQCVICLKEFCLSHLRYARDERLYCDGCHPVTQHLGPVIQDHAPSSVP